MWKAGVGGSKISWVLQMTNAEIVHAMTRKGLEAGDL